MSWIENVFHVKHIIVHYSLHKKHVFHVAVVSCSRETHYCTLLAAQGVNVLGSSGQVTAT
jgi:hypothetical protein